MRNVTIVLAVAFFCRLFSVAHQIASAEPSVLNNLVTELVNAASIPAKPAYQEITFTNPRDGWVFVSATTRLDISGQAAESNDIVKIAIDGGKDDAVLSYRFGDATTKETMRFLTAGEHKLRIWFPQKPDRAELDIRNLVVRAVPALVYCAHPTVSKGYYGVYSDEFLEKDVLPNINTIVGEGALRYEDLQNEWKARGGKWYIEMNIPSLARDWIDDVPKPLTADYTYDFWTQSLGFSNPHLDGLFADEFMWTKNQRPDFPAYVEALKRVAADERFKGRSIHGWTFGKEMYSEPAGQTLLQAFISSGYKIAWEYYPSEAATEAALHEDQLGKLRTTMQDWEKQIPGLVNHIIFVQGYMSAPPHSLNTDPGVDFKVFLDHQFKFLATAPESAGLYGIMAYKARYADEEYLRWTGQLYRHYCIEGNTGLLSDEYGFKYNPGHITNADFDDGLAGWTIDEAVPGSIQAGKMDGLGAMQGRFLTPGAGNNYLLTKRTSDKPNRISQKISNLVPGNLYSLKLLLSDCQDFVNGESVRKRLAVSVAIDNVVMLPERCLVLEVDGISHCSVGPFEGKTPPWTNYHRLVFRALETTAPLTISDWADETDPGGPIGQEIMYNFVELEPYFQ